MTPHRSLWLLLGILAAAGCGRSSGFRTGAPTDSVATAPQLLNAEQVAEAIEREYPPDLRQDGLSGSVRLRLLVGTDGIPAEVRVLESSGYPRFDQAASRVAVFLRFSPALDNAGRPVQVWVAFPISFRVR